MRDWRDWHVAYGDPGSPLSQRLAVVQAQLRDLLDQAPPGPVRVVSACAGEGRDVLGLAGHPRAGDVRALLVEQDAELSARARVLLADLDVDVVTADAGSTSAYEGQADVLLLCGVFGNVPDADVARTIGLASSLCAEGAAVVWTRHRREPDLTPDIRRWWRDAGFEELAFVSPGPGAFAVGTCRLSVQPASYEPGVRLFAFEG